MINPRRKPVSRFISVKTLKHILLFCWLLSQYTITLGCFCVTPEDSVERADVIFTGIARTEMRASAQSNDTYNLEGYVEFDVDSILKGDESVRACDRIAIIQGTSSCYFQFDQDSAYVVFASYASGNDSHDRLPFLTTSQCTGTNRISISKVSMESNLRSVPHGGGSSVYQILFVLSLLINVVLIIWLGRSGRLHQTTPATRN